MSKIVNLNQFRKRTSQAEKRRKADSNSVKFGRTKMEKALDKARAAKADQDLDGHHRE